MRNLGRVVWIAMVISFGFAYADSVKATVNTQEVVKGNPVELRIKAIGGAAAFPDISDINGVGVSDSGTSKQSSMSITGNGIKRETSTVKKYIFTPTHDMTIPSYTVNISGKAYKTDPISIKVVKSSAPTVQDNGKFSFVIKTDKKSVYVGESFIMSLYVSVSQGLNGIQISDYAAPMSKDFFIKEVGGQKEYQDSGYNVIEKQYIVTTKREGNFTISPASAKLGQPDMSRQDIFGRYATKWTPIISNKLNVEVKAQPTPTDLVGDFSLDASVDRRKVKANKPVNLTLKIDGKGSLEDFEFPKYDIDGVTVYSDAAKIETSVEHNELVSHYTKSFAFISDTDFSIPARSISVYNPKTKESITLEVPAYDIKVEGKKASASVAASAPQVHMQRKGAVEPKIVEKTVEVKSTAWWMLVLAFISGGLFVYLLRFIPALTKEKKRHTKESDVLKILYAHMSEDKEVEAMVRKLYAKKSGDKSVKIDKKELKKMVERFS